SAALPGNVEPAGHVERDGERPARGERTRPLQAGAGIHRNPPESEERRQANHKLLTVGDSERVCKWKLSKVTDFRLNRSGSGHCADPALARRIASSASS